MKKILPLLFMFAAFNVFAHEVEIKTESNSKIEIKADIANITLALKTKGNTSKLAQNENSESMNKFLEELKKENIHIGNIQTKRYSYNRVYENSNDYDHNSTVRFEILTNHTDVASLIENLEKIGFSKYRINGNTFIFEISNISDSKEKNLKEIYAKVNTLRLKTGREFVFKSLEDTLVSKKDREEKYEVETMFSFQLRDVSKLNKLIEISQKYNMYINEDIQYGVSNLKDAYLNLYKKSYANAKSKALHLAGKGYRIKEVTNISEDKYLAEVAQRRQLDEVPVAYMLKSAAPVNITENLSKPNLEIPKVTLENKLDISFLATDGKNDKVDNKKVANLFGTTTKEVAPDFAQIYFNISTTSNTSLDKASSDNAKILEKVKDVLKLAKLDYDIETVGFLSDKHSSYENYTEYTGEEKTRGIILANVGEVTSKNYEKFLNILDKYEAKLIKKNNEIAIEIAREDKDSKNVYKKVNTEFTNLSNELRKYDINVALLEFKNEKIRDKKNISRKVEIFTNNHSVKLTTRSLKDISLIVSVLREIGVSLDNITYMIDDVSKYEKEVYSEVLENISNKKASLESIDDIKLGKSIKIEEIGGGLDPIIYVDRIYGGIQNVKFDINTSNKEILERAYKNLQSIYIQNRKVDAKLSIYIEIN